MHEISQVMRTPYSGPQYITVQRAAGWRLVDSATREATRETQSESERFDGQGDNTSQGPTALEVTRSSARINARRRRRRDRNARTHDLFINRRHDMQFARVNFVPRANLPEACTAHEHTHMAVATDEVVGLKAHSN